MQEKLEIHTQIWSRNLNRKEHLGTHGCRWIILKWISRCDDAGCIQLAQNKVKWQTVYW